MTTPIKKQIGSIAILIGDREKNSRALNDLLTENGNLIIARLGVNLKQICQDGCGFISLVVEGSAKDINEFAKKIDKLYGIKAKAVIL